MWKSNANPTFRSSFAETIFNQKYRHEGCETWLELCRTLVNDVCEDKLPKDDKDQLIQYMYELKLIPGGRYIYYAGRKKKFFNNCFLLSSLEDTREDWAELSKKAELCLSVGGGIGNDYSVYRGRGSVLHGTGGVASGPVPKMAIINEIGRNIIQGGSRRSAIYASLNHRHPDISEFLNAKNWQNIKVAGTDKTLADLKEADFNFPCPLDMTNISVNYDTSWLTSYWNTGKVGDVFLKNTRQALSTGEPGFSFNFFDKEKETLRNACVPAGTMILTDQGYKDIASVLSQSVNVWNGREWSAVTPFSTGINNLMKVTLSDGASLTCTPYHKFILAGGTRVCADELNIGDRLEKFSMPVVDAGGDIGGSDAYSQGFYAGDGNNGYTYSYVYEPKYSVIPRLKGTVKAEPDNYKRRIWTHGVMLGKSFVPVTGTKQYCLDWLAGLCDADATVTNDANGNGIQLCSIDFGFLLNVKLMLTRLGVCAKIAKGNTEGYRAMPNGQGGTSPYFCQTTYRLLIGNTDTYNLTMMGFSPNRLVLHKTPPQRDARRFVTVVSVQEYGSAETYCFNEPLAHRGTFNGIVTGQCTEVTSEDDSDVCNLASVNMANIPSINEFMDVVELGIKFLLLGTRKADLPYDQVYKVREKNRRLGLGLMGIHEWLIQRGYKYEVTPELHQWLAAYSGVSTHSSKAFADALGISRPVANRAIAPTGSIAILAGTTTAIEPIFAVAYKRRYLKGNSWKYQYVVDSTARNVIEKYGVKPDEIETALHLAKDFGRRIKFQADIQDYVDMSISSTINLPKWGTEGNTEDGVEDFASTLAKYSPRLRGMTVYPDGSRGGQPLVAVPYAEAVDKLGTEFEDAVEATDICAITGRGGTCGV